MENIKSSSKMAVKDTVIKILKWLAIPFVVIGLFLLRSLGLKKDAEASAKIKDLEKETKETKKEVGKAEKDSGKKKDELDKVVDDTKKTVEKISSDKKDRDKTADKFFK